MCAIRSLCKKTIEIKYDCCTTIRVVHNIKILYNQNQIPKHKRIILMKLFTKFCRSFWKIVNYNLPIKETHSKCVSFIDAFLLSATKKNFFRQKIVVFGGEKYPCCGSILLIFLTAFFRLKNVKKVSLKIQFFQKYQ